jgi:transposase-like protein
MAKKRYQAEHIIGKLREAEGEISKGQTIGQITKKLGITEQTYYRWRKEYGGLRTDQAKRLKELEKENARLKRLVANQALDMKILKEAASGNFCARRNGVKQSSTSVVQDVNECRSAGPVR